MKIPNSCKCDAEMYSKGQICNDCRNNEELIQSILAVFDGRIFSDRSEKLWFAVNACLRLIQYKFEQDEMFGNISMEEFETIENCLGEVWAKNFWSSIFSNRTRTNEVSE